MLDRKIFVYDFKTNAYLNIGCNHFESALIHIFSLDNIMIWKILNKFIILDIAVSFLVVVTGDTVEYFIPGHDDPVNYKLHDLYKDGIRIENKSAVSFQVKCEKGAYVLLQENKNDYKNLVVEVVLGSLGNMGISISDKHSHRFSWCRVPNILSRYEYQPFWISWENNHIRIGKGFRPNSNGFSCSEIASSAINYISIGTGGNISGYWKFYTAEEPFTTSSISPLFLANQTLTSYTRNTTTNANGKAEKDLTPVYIAVPVVTVVALLIVIAIIFFRRYQRSPDKTKHDVVYINTVASTSSSNRQLGIKNPMYDELNKEVFENNKSESHCLTADNYSTIDAVKRPEVTFARETISCSTELPADQISNDLNAYDKLSHAQGQTDVDKEGDGFRDSNAYSHIVR